MIRPNIYTTIYVIALTIFAPHLASASLTLSWQDNSDNEDGFRIERQEESAPDYAEHAVVAANQTSFVDNTVIDGQDYCYRVSGFNAAGNSGYTETKCAFGLTVNLAGTGTGTVTGSGIDCGGVCSQTYPADAVVALTAAPAAGSLFAGWDGDNDCLDGTITMDVAKNCTAAFELEPPPPPPPVSLAVNIINTLTEHGSGDGSVTSSPAGIDCRTDCSESFAAGTTVALTAIPDATSVFTGWSGGACGGTSTCTVTLNGDTVVSAVFEPEVFTVIVSVVGAGTVRGSGIDCGEDCSETYRSGEPVALTATEEEGWSLDGWSESECGLSVTCQLAITEDKSVVATFGEKPPPFPIVIGEVEVDHNWTRVALDESFFNEPVVVAGVGYNDPAPGIVRIRNVDATGFDVRFQEWDYLDGIHNFETVEYIVIERGTYILDDGTRLEANTITTAAVKGFEPVKFDQLFNTMPVVLTAVASANESDAVIARVQNVTTEGFNVRLREQEANRRKHATERVDYVAWEPFVGPLGPIAVEVRTTPGGVTDDWYAMDFETQFAAGPVFVSGMQTHNGGDTATVRSKDKDAASIALMVQEEQSKNPEVKHVAEAIGYIAAE